MALEVGIKVDPADSVSKADAVEEALHRTEDRGIAAGQAMQRLSGAFKSLGDAIAQHMAAMERANAVHDRLARANQPLVKSFGGVAEAIKREQEMLERIHGPAQRYAADLQTLDSLLDRNKISTAEYAAEVAKLNRAIEGAPKPSVAAANHPQAGPGMFGSLRGVAAAAGVTFGVREAGELANEYQNLQNRLRYLAGGDMQKVNELFEQLQGVASRTRGDLSSTTEAFVRMSLATKQMGLSNNETLQLTERLNKAIALSGATSAEAAAGMIQLSQGLASGALRGDELRSVMEQLPAVADVIAQGMGVTRGELRNLGADGKITAEVIVEAFRKAGTALDQDFGNTVPTIGQSLTLFKNELIVTVGELDKSIGASKMFGDVLGVVDAALKLIIVPLQLVGAGLDAIGVSGSTAALGMAGFIAAGPVGAIAGVTVGLLAQAGAFDDIGGQLNDMIDRYKKWDELMKAANRDLNEFSGKEMKDAIGALTEYNLRMTLGAAAAEAFMGALTGTTQAIANQADVLKKANAMAEAQGLGKNDDMGETIERNLNKAAHAVLALENARKRHHKTLSDEEKLLKRLHGDYDQMIKDLASLEVLYAQRKITEQEYGNEVERINKALEERRRLLSGGVTKGMSIAIPNDGITGNMLDAAAAANETAGIDWERFNKGLENMREGARELQEEIARQAEEKAQRTREAWASAMGDVAGSFIRAAREGKQSFAEMAEQMMTDISKVILKMATMKMIEAGGGVAVAGTFLQGMLGGFATGGSFTVPYDTDRFVLPRAARGADWMIGGHGPTDSKILMARVTPGESVHIRTPQQQAMAAQAAAGPGHVTVVAQMMNNERDVVESGESYGAQRVFVRNQRRYGRRTR